VTDDESRLHQIALPFVRANRELEARSRGLHFDKDSLVCALVTGTLPLACFLVARRYPQPASYWFMGLGVAVLLMSGLWLWTSLTTDVRRHLERKVMPRLVSELLPLAPTEEEIQEVLDVLGSQRFLIAQLLGARFPVLDPNPRK
jgi:hypothetical protein